MTIKGQLAEIKARGRLEGFEQEIRMLSVSLDGAPMWLPAAALKKQCGEVSRLLGELEERFDRKLIVTILGPCGSGKSTLLNALAGVDDLSESGHNRPTTRHLVVLCRDESDAGPLREKFGKENVEIRSSHAASALEHVLLIDTPDTDSMEQEKHIPMVHQAVSFSDVLICVFNAENPKTRDYVDFLAPYVRHFNGESLVCAANKSDRLDELELREKIVPEFLAYVRNAWEKPVDRVFCISARRHLHDPVWDTKAKPRHDFDEFAQLQEMIFSTFNRAAYVIDRRLENAENLRNYIAGEIRAEVEKDKAVLADARQRITELEKKAAKDALSALKNDDSRQVLGVNVLLYQKLAQRWLGPVGWLIALWARILIFGTGIAAIFRFGNPIRQIMGIASSLLHFRESQAAVADVGKSEQVDRAFRDYRFAIMKTWADIAEMLIKARFDPSVRHIDAMLPDSDVLNKELSSLWREALDRSIETAARRLSGLFLQFIFNIPVIGMLAYTGWLTARAFFLDHYLTSDFFMHAFLTIGIVLFLSFFIFQGCVRLFAGAEAVTAKAFEDVKARLEQFHPISMNPVGEQAGAVLELRSEK